jgi:hypothetical protein
MKNLFLSFSFLLFTVSLLSAQDYILKRDGQEIYCKVKEVNLSTVIYTDTSRSDSVRHVLNKSEVFIIKYQNGIKEVYQQEEKKPETTTVIIYKKAKDEYEGPITDLGSNDYQINGRVYHFKEVRRILLSSGDEDIKRLLTMAKVNGVVGNILAYSSIPFGYVGLLAGAAGASDGETGLEVAGVVLGAICLISNATNIVLKVSKRKKIKEAIALYNERIEERSKNK